MKAHRSFWLTTALLMSLMTGTLSRATAGESPFAGMDAAFAQAPASHAATASTGAQFTMNLAPDVNRNVGSFVKRLNPMETRLLTSRDIIIVIDKSGSMDERDCPATTPMLGFVERLAGTQQAISRWDWCANELVNLGKETAAGMQTQNNMRVVLYASDVQSFDRVGWYQIPQIFRQNRPGGGTNQAAALRGQFEDYFARKGRFGAVRPVIIAVITDGLPTSPSAVKSALIEATRKLQRPNEIAVTFLQVGRERKGANLVHQLDDRLLSEGANFDIVDCKDFGELSQRGLARALVDAIKEVGG